MRKIKKQYSHSTIRLRFSFIIIYNYFINLNDDDDDVDMIRSSMTFVLFSYASYYSFGRKK